MSLTHWPVVTAGHCSDEAQWKFSNRHCFSGWNYRLVLRQAARGDPAAAWVSVLISSIPCLQCNPKESCEVLWSITFKVILDTYDNGVGQKNHSGEQGMYLSTPQEVRDRNDIALLHSDFSTNRRQDSIMPTGSRLYPFKKLKSRQRMFSNARTSDQFTIHFKICLQIKL